MTRVPECSKKCLRSASVYDTFTSFAESKSVATTFSGRKL